MSRTGRFVLRLLLAGALGGGAYAAWVSSFGSPAPVDLLPSGAIGVLEVRDAEGLASRLSGTRFAATFAQSATREWLERTELVQAFDATRSEIGRIIGISPGRGSAFDLFGAEAAVGWYPPAGNGLAAAPWVAGSRLSVRAWVAAGVMRLGVRFIPAVMNVRREELAGRALYSIPGNAGESLHLFLVGRVLVGGPDRSLVLKAASSVGDRSGALTHEPSWQAVRGALPAQGELFAWARDRGAVAAYWPGAGAARGSVGIRLRAGRTVEIDVAAQPASVRTASQTPGGGPQSLPGIALLRQAPLLLLASSEPVPSVLADLLQARRDAVARRSAATAAPEPALRPGNGYAVVVTDSAGGTGLFPAPRGLVLVGMPSSAESSRVLPLLFPPGAREATGGGTRALATRESFPLAGQFDLWGAAIGPQLVFATDPSLFDAVRADTGTAADRPSERASWPVSTVAAVSMEKALPLLKRWGAPLSGLVAAKWPDSPGVARDLGLLAAVGTVRVAAGSDDRFDRAAITLDVHDLR